MMWGGGDGSSDATRGPAPSSGPMDSMPGGAGAAGAVEAAGAMGRGNREASETNGSAGPDIPLPPPGMGQGGEEAVSDGGYGEELGQGQNGGSTLDGEEVMDDPFEPDAESDDGFFGDWSDWGGEGGGGGGGGDWGGDVGDLF